jgi:hypothetical protein
MHVPQPQQPHPSYPTDIGGIGTTPHFEQLVLERIIPLSGIRTNTISCLHPLNPRNQRPRQPTRHFKATTLKQKLRVPFSVSTRLLIVVVRKLCLYNHEHTNSGRHPHSGHFREFRIRTSHLAIMDYQTAQRQARASYRHSCLVAKAHSGAHRPASCFHRSR